MPLHVIVIPAHSQVPDAAKKVKKAPKSKSSTDKDKASFKRPGGKRGSLKSPSETGNPASASGLKYGEYSLEKIPQEARPDTTKRNLGNTRIP